jgi:hypothetical protein
VRYKPPSVISRLPVLDLELVCVVGAVNHERTNYRTPYRRRRRCCCPSTCQSSTHETVVLVEVWLPMVCPCTRLHDRLVARRAGTSTAARRMANTSRSNCLVISLAHETAPTADLCASTKVRNTPYLLSITRTLNEGHRSYCLANPLLHDEFGSSSSDLHN